jgi:hypothetical protein
VALDVTYKTHPALDSIVGLGVTMNTTSTQKLAELSETFFRALPNMTDQGQPAMIYFTPLLLTKMDRSTRICLLADTRNFVVSSYPPQQPGFGINKRNDAANLGLDLRE